MELEQLLKKNKPDASKKTMNNYISNLNLLYKNITGEKGYFNIEKFNKFTTEELVDCINKHGVGKSHSYVRNLLSSLKAYNLDKSLTKFITDSSNAEKAEYSIPEATEAVKSHHLTPEMLDAKYLELETKSNPLWKKTDWTMDDFQTLQHYVMYCIVSGRWIAPRRSQDWVHFKLRNINLDSDNYIDGKNFVFNTYKTSKQKGQQIIPIPEELYKIIKKWVRFNQLEYMFVNSELKPLTATTFGQNLNKIMGGTGFGTNCFRHCYLTNKYENILDLEKDMTAMGSGLNEARHYIKKL